MLSLNENELAAAEALLMFGNALTDRHVRRLDRLLLEFETNGAIVHERSSLQADPDCQMLFWGTVALALLGVHALAGRVL